MPEFPSEVPDLIYLCFPNNPTGSAITKDGLQKWVDYANKNGCVIIYDAAYEAYISEENVPHSIYECEGARTCAIELRAFLRMPDLLVFVLDLRLFRRNWYEMGYHFTVCGQDVTAPSLTVLLILYRRQERLSILRQVRLS